MSSIQDSQRMNAQPTKTFNSQYVLNDVKSDPEQERLALAYMNRHAPDLVGMVLGGVL